MSESWTLDIDSEGIGWLVFDVPDQKVNTFGAESLDGLSGILEELETNDSLRCLVIRSGKPKGFIAGADIDELSKITSAEEAKTKAEIGRGVFGRLEKLKVPTVAVINGACLGGGLEMALACTWRLATTDPSTKLGLPEVNLGILPGWGGTQRLPALVGLARGLPMIIAGKPVDGRRAYKMGLVDGLVAPAFLEQQTREFLRRALEAGGRAEIQRRRRRLRPRIPNLLEKLPGGRALIYRKAAAEVVKKTGGHYPAPLEALAVIKRTYRRKVEDPWAIETEGFCRLAATPINRHLVWLFQASQRAGRPPAEKATDFNRAAVVGAGIMGGGIAWALSNVGMTVRLKDISWEVLARGVKQAASMYRALVKRRKRTSNEMILAMHRIEPTVTYSGFGRADLVVEAVIEDLDLKKKVLAEIEREVPAGAIIASNTSSLPLNDLAAALEHPERFIGLHFFNPVNRMPLVEVVPAETTSPQVVAAATALIQKLKKTPVVVGDCAGFLVNRILLPYLVESAWMLEEIADPGRIDRVLEGFGMPMGPLTLVDEVGLDVGTVVARELETAYGERMRVPRVLGMIVEETDWKGKKSGTGIYRYLKGRKRPNRKLGRIVRSARRADQLHGRKPSDAEIIDRAILIMVNEAARCLDERIVPDAETLDLAMVMGTGFCPFRGGLLRYADERGLGEIKQRLDELAKSVGPRFRPAPLLERLASEGGRFHADAQVPEDAPQGGSVQAA
jgi:3-hydroxyacyl-CoA dehydrogenase/enoyl-CoA hydratase/3-hydroxybutyryl-CoA epimerase